jgi:phenylalanyl-tRNA synthetase alpha chain
VAYTVPKPADFSEAELNKSSDELLAALEEESKLVTNEVQYKAFRDKWIARKAGHLTQVNEQWLKSAPPSAKRLYGIRVNEINGIVAQKVKEQESLYALKQKLSGIVKSNYEKHFPDQIYIARPEQLDITLPGTRRPIGAEHPIIQTMNEIVGVFRNLGYSVEEGPEIETDYYNFEALNFPPNHPARDTQDTLFVANQESKPQRDRLLLRTHTSPVQIRTMQKMKPPVRVVCPGKVHRNDAPDATHSPVFHQVEGLAVDTNITFCDLKGTLDHAMKALFGSSVKTRFYPSFFPFTEPSADVQISCIFCGGKGQRDGGPCRNCKASGWIELLGCGMVDPNVYGFVDYDPKKVSGFAFGMGVERIAILKYGVDDIQLFFNGDVRFLEQFG